MTTRYALLPTFVVKVNGIRTGSFQIRPGDDIVKIASHADKYAVSVLAKYRVHDASAMVSVTMDDEEDMVAKAQDLIDFWDR